MYDVVVAGSGPIGSYTASRLADKGHRILVLDKKQRAGESVCCTGIIGLECVNKFSIEDRVILRQVNSASLFPPSGEPLHVERQETQACILDRVALDVSMAERAEKAGAEYRFNSRVKDINIESDHASVAVFGQGKEYDIPTKSVVIATGFTPGLLRRLRLGRFRDFTTGAQVEVEANGIDEVEVYFGDIAPGFFGWMVPTTPSMARIGLMSRKKPGFYLKKWLEQLTEQGRITSPEADISYGAIPLRPLQRTYGERLIVVGDAAGQVKPTSGGGIYYGLLSADIAAEVLHQALQDGDLSANKLSKYEREWRKILGREMKIGYWARKLFERLSNRRINRIFEIARTGGIDRAMLEAKDLSFDWHSKTILRLLKYQLVARAVKLIKLPLRIGRIDR